MFAGAALLTAFWINPRRRRRGRAGRMLAGWLETDGWAGGCLAQKRQSLLGPVPLCGFEGAVGRIAGGKILQDIGPNRWRQVRKVVAIEPAQQVGISLVGQPVFAFPREQAGVQIAVGNPQVARRHLLDRKSVV